MANEPVERDFKEAVKRGIKLTCPRCGKGEILHSYIKVNDKCSECSLDLTKARVDDAGIYLTVLITVHVIAVVLHISLAYLVLSNIALFLVLASVAIVVALYLLPRSKGAIIGIQWAKEMHGF